MEKQMQFFSWNHHRQKFFSTVFNLREQEMFCDITLACDGALFPAHRLVLCMCSDFFREILTKVPLQQPMMVLLVPTVQARDLNALLTYMYEGEINICKTNLPSFMQAARALKIQGLCEQNAVSWGQQMRQSEERGGATADQDDHEESSIHESVASVPPDWSTKEEPEDLDISEQPLHRELPEYAQVEVFIDDDEDNDGIKEESNDVEEREDFVSVVNDEGEENDNLDPLSVSLPPPHLSSIVSAISSHPDVSDAASPTVMTEDPDTLMFHDTFHTPSGLTSAVHRRYTKAQKLQMWNYYHTIGPVKGARLMSRQLGRKLNESTIRSVVKSFRRRHNYKEMVQT